MFKIIFIALSFSFCFGIPIDNQYNDREVSFSTNTTNNQCNSNDGPIPNEKDEHKYFVCANGVLVEEPCPTGLVFDKVSKECQYSKSSTNTQCNVNDGPIPDEKDEHKYYLCSNGILVEESCPLGLVFDKTGHDCSYSTNTTNKCNPNDGPIPDEKDERKYYLCSNGVLVEESCPNGLVFDKTSKECQYSKSSTNTECNVNDGPIPDEKDEHKYYLCSNGLLVEESCPTGLVFDKVAKLCQYSSNSTNTECNPNDGPMPDEKDERKFYLCQNGKKVEESCPTGLVFDKVSKECQYSKNSTNTECNDSDGPTPNEKDDNKFYLCSNGKKVLESCPPGLVFDKVIKDCNYRSKTTNKL